VEQAPCNEAVASGSHCKSGYKASDMRLTSDVLLIVLLSEYIKRDSGAGTPGTGGSSRPPSTSSVTSGCWGGDVSSGGTGYQQRRGSLQLWQFLVALLDDPSNSSCISWTGRGMEFKLVEPEEVSGFSADCTDDRMNACEDRSVWRSCQVAPKSPRNKTNLELRPPYKFRSIAIISLGHGQLLHRRKAKKMFQLCY
jgi:hypothetical protein